MSVFVIEGHCLIDKLLIEKRRFRLQAILCMCGMIVMGVESWKIFKFQATTVNSWILNCRLLVIVMILWALFEAWCCCIQGYRDLAYSQLILDHEVEGWTWPIESWCRHHHSGNLEHHHPRCANLQPGADGASFGARFTHTLWPPLALWW